jgi:hypothetical protein
MEDSKGKRLWQAVKDINAFRWILGWPLLGKVGALMIPILAAGFGFYKELPLGWIIALPFLVVLAAILLVLAGYNLWEKRSSFQIHIDVSPTAGFNPQQFLVVTNNGKETTFTAECQIQAFNAQSQFPTGKFHLGWGDGNKRSVRIARDASERLLIASFRDEIPHVRWEMTLWQVVENSSRGQHWAWWDAEGDDLIPSYLLSVFVIADGTKKPWKSNFVLKPQSNLGPLTMEFIGVPI